MNYVRSLRTLYNVPIAKELCAQIYAHSEKCTNVLDMGCGTGDLTIPLAQQLTSSVVHGCDISVKAIEEANKASGQVGNLDFSKQNINELPKSWAGKFDVILMFDVLHDLQDPEIAMKQVMSVLKKNGTIIIVDPKVSRDPLNNVGNIQAAHALTLSTWWCVPSSSCNCGSGNGVGWENKEAFLLRIPGLEIKSRVCLINSDYNYAYICKKK
ncbi:ubiquinone/menaquinone biosynthesis C-methyltransferase UbiE-like [Pecten maximus]|uniref:ubiquinone/menaquinone biosynthesis C-methyltransferase UbiE-like n=1 Tax=Pecten maximus TaxID=6579 RepID=UPI00145889DE|nr:ubiquinone/menaquinone biosynthesis C-methyltransferase UbiE-like [Pecten maximus]